MIALFAAGAPAEARAQLAGAPRRPAVSLSARAFQYDLSGAGGVRAWLTDRVGLRGELRVRGIGSGFTGAVAEWTLGVSRRF